MLITSVLLFSPISAAHNRGNSHCLHSANDQRRGSRRTVQNKFHLVSCSMDGVQSSFSHLSCIFLITFINDLDQTGRLRKQSQHMRFKCVLNIIDTSSQPWWGWSSFYLRGGNPFLGQHAVQISKILSQQSLTSYGVYQTNRAGIHSRLTHKIGIEVSNAAFQCDWCLMLFIGRTERF